MVIKTVKGRHTESYTCRHVVVDESDTGIRIELCGAGDLAPRFIDMPKDAERVFQMSDRGDTQDSWVWPPKQKRQDSPTQAREARQ